jgi:hypothetical protein
MAHSSRETERGEQEIGTPLSRCKCPQFLDKNEKVEQKVSPSNSHHEQQYAISSCKQMRKEEN